MDYEDKSAKKGFSIALTDASDLIERQSVRATFRISAEFIDAIRALSAQLGIKQKSLFDHLMEDRDLLRAIAESAEPDQLDRRTRIQKTFVISKKSLNSLDIISKSSEASRDDLVEYSIQRLLPILKEERKKQNQREAAMDKITVHFTRSVELLEEILATVGEDDPVFKTMETVLAAYGNAFEQMESLVSSGKRITSLPMEKFKS